MAVRSSHLLSVFLTRSVGHQWETMTIGVGIIRNKEEMGMTRKKVWRLEE